MTTSPSPASAGLTRRDVLAAGAAAATLATLAPAVHAAGGDTLKVGLIGCGGRGTGAATQALRADSNVKLTALGDMFPDKIEKCIFELNKEKDIASKFAFTKETCFTGFDAYKKVIDSGVDVVLLCSPPGFRPAHIEAAVEAGKHVFAEKPVATDAPGVRAVLKTCQKAKDKSLSVVSGLCYRYENAKRETMKRIHEGAIGDIVALHTTYNARELWSRKREKEWTDMEWQLRNWLYFTWLSGDHNVEQHVHSLDKMAWAMKDEYPVKANGMGGRQSRTATDFGHIFDHHAVVYEYENGVKIFSFCRQQNGCKVDVSDYIMGTQGTCDVMRHSITGKTTWKHNKRRGEDDMYQNEHDALFASIRASKPINNGDYMCKSTLMGIMGRMATYTGQEITWKQALNSEENLMPAKLAFGPLDLPAVAIPGKTEFK